MNAWIEVNPFLLDRANITYDQLNEFSEFFVHDMKKEKIITATNIGRVLT